MIKSIAIMAAILVMVACSKKIISTTSIVVKDSIVYHHTNIYDTVLVPMNDVGINWMNPSDTTIEKKNGRADLRIIERSGKIAADCKCDSLLIVKKLSRKDTLHFKSIVTNKQSVKLVPVTSNFDRFCHIWFFATASLLAGGIAIKLSKFFT